VQTAALLSTLAGPSTVKPTDRDQRIPQGVEDFLYEHIDRLETMQVLMLLHSSAPRSWSIRQVSLERQSSTDSAEVSLRRLSRAGLLVQEEGMFRFEPLTSRLAEQAAWLVWWYQASPDSVMRLIFYGGPMPN
jgi:hypothetical protein